MQIKWKPKEPSIEKKIKSQYAQWESIGQETISVIEFNKRIFMQHTIIQSTE